MTGTSTKKIGSIFLLCIFFNTSTTTERPWYNACTETQLPWLIIGAVTALILGKISYNYYQSYPQPHEQCIENCRSIYKKIHQDIQYYHNFHCHDVQISDWELKEIIVQNQQTSYPFIAYHSLLAKSSWVLKKHLATVKNQLKKINRHKKQLISHKQSESTAHLKENFLQLTIRGQQLLEYTIKTITLVSILKKRIKLFKEYNDDCYNWSQEIKKQKISARTTH